MTRNHPNGAASHSRRSRALFHTGLLLALAAAPATAQRIGVTINGEPVPISGIGPQQIQGRVLVPVRGVLENLGAAIAWLPARQTVIASSGNMDIQLRIGDRIATVNGRPVTLDVPAQIIAGSTMVPLRFLGEALGADVGWNGQTRTVAIVTSAQVGQQPKPPQTPAPTPNRAPTIDSFTHNARGWLRPGETLRATLEGTPGGEAEFRIPGVADAIPMRETESGRYVGQWQVPTGKPIHLADAAVIGSLRVNGREAPLIQAGQKVSIDAAPPKLRDRSPEPNARITRRRPNIYAVFEDQGSGVDRKEVRLFVNGQDMTEQANVTRDFISFTPEKALAPGAQNVQLIVSDVAGNKTQSAWKFIAEAREQGIRAIKHNASGTLEPGDTLRVEATGEPGGKATFTLGSIKDIPMRETQAGSYAATYTIRKGDDLAEGRLAVRLVTADGERYVQQAEQEIRVSTGKPMEPVITYPGPNDKPTNPLVIKGKGTPNTQVHVKVDYRNRLLGVLALSGTAADVVVDVNKEGIWQTEPINIRSLLGSRDMEVTITAVGENSAGQESTPVELSFRLR